MAEYNASGAMLRRYVHGAGIDDPVAWYEGPGFTAMRGLHANHQGSIVLVKEAGVGVIGVNTYDEYGIPGASNIGRFQYTGQIWLPELGMYYYKARIYSPTLGRFLQTDPIGYDDGPHLYAYVGNDPVNKTDPTGMYACGDSMSKRECAKFQANQAAQAAKLQTSLQLLRGISAKLGAGERLSRAERAVIARIGSYLGQNNANAKGVGFVIKVGQSALNDLRSNDKVAQVDRRMETGGRAMVGGLGIYVGRDLGGRGSTIIHEGIHTGTNNFLRDRNWGGRDGAYDQEMQRRVARSSKPEDAVSNADNWVSALGFE